jgi:hypothetical protein
MHRIAAIVCLGLAVAGCREREPSPSLSDDRFIEVVVALRQEAATLAGDSARYVVARERILAEQNVTYEQLQEYVEARSRDLARYASVWETINRRLAPEQRH